MRPTTNYAMASVSIAHTYGNVTACIVELLKQQFPKNYFKTIHVSSKMAYREFNVFQNSNTEFLKKNKPMLIVRPRVEMDDSDNFLYGTYLTSRITDGMNDVDFNNLQPFLFDRQKGIEMRYLMNRMKMSFDISIILDTQMEQINQAVYLKNKLPINNSTMVQLNLENNIEKVFFEAISKESGIPIYDENGNVGRFLTYVNSISQYPITYKMKNSTGKDEFFRFYTANVDTTFSGISIDDGSKKGFVDSAYAITFTITTEFYTGGMNYYFTRDREIIDAIDMGIQADNSGRIIPIFTVQELNNPQLPFGWELISYPMYKVESVPDVMSIKPVLNNSIDFLIDYHIKNGIDINTFLVMIIKKDDVQLTEGVDYILDYNTRTLKTLNANRSSTYRMLMFANVNYMNTLISDITGFNEEK